MIKKLPKAPPFKWEPASLFKYGGYLFGLALLSALTQAVIQFITGLLALGAICCVVAAIVLSISKALKK